jgi:hypothetical protein
MASPSIPPRLLRRDVRSDARPNIGTCLRDTVVGNFFGRRGFGRDILLLALGLGAVDLALSRPFRVRRLGVGGFNEVRLPTQLERPSAGTGGGGESFSLGGFGVRLLGQCPHLSRAARCSFFVHSPRFLVGCILADAGIHSSPIQ